MTYLGHYVFYMLARLTRKNACPNCNVIGWAQHSTGCHLEILDGEITRLLQKEILWEHDTEE